jgi:hypothetical protein
MLNVIVETKNDYTIHLTNIMAPLVFEGIQSVYTQSLDVVKNNDVLKIFQSFLKSIPKWNQDMIEKETNRIINSSQSYEWLNDLIKATLKATLIVLMYNPNIKTQSKVDPSLYQNIKTSEFIHRIYIECARELWNNPYLLYHNYPPIEIKRNQRDCINIIKECIKEALRKLLPVKHILQIYLGEDIEVDKNEDQFEKALSDVEERNLAKIIQKDLNNDVIELGKNEDYNEKPLFDIKDINIVNIIEKDLEDTNKLEFKEDLNLQNNIQILSSKEETFLLIKSDKLIKSNSEEKTIGSKILNIINKNSISSNDIVSSDHKYKDEKSIEISDSYIVDDNTKTEHTSSYKLSVDDLQANLSVLGADKPANIIDVKSFDVKSFDDKIKKVLHHDLATNSDLETSLNYSQEENNNKYHEIFSNSIVGPDKTINDVSKSVKDKSKFFNNYLHF